MFNTSRNSPRPAPPHRPAWPLRWSAAGAFGFDSSPGLGQWPSVTHAYWLFADFGPFSSQTVFCVCVFFTEFPLVFSRYSARLKEQGYCLKVSWTCSRSGASCLRLSGGRGGTLPGVYACVNKSSLHQCKRNSRTMQSLVCRY